MSLAALRRRIAALERKQAAQFDMVEIEIIGGLPDTAPFATLLPSGDEITAGARELQSTFERRARSAAKEQGAGFVVFGGLPNAATMQSL